jgi:hypothetical protein
MSSSRELAEVLESTTEWDDGARALDAVLWQEVSSIDGYEKVTF